MNPSGPMEDMRIVSTMDWYQPDKCCLFDRPPLLSRLSKGRQPAPTKAHQQVGREPSASKKQFAELFETIRQTKRKLINCYISRVIDCCFAALGHSVMHFSNLTNHWWQIWRTGDSLTVLTRAGPDTVNAFSAKEEITEQIPAFNKDEMREKTDDNVSQEIM